MQHDAERVADVVGAEFTETFGAVAALQHKGLALARQRQLLFQLARLARKDQRRVFGQLGFGTVQRGHVRIIRHLHPWLGAPI